MRRKMLAIMVCILVACFLISCASKDTDNAQGNSNSIEAIKTFPTEIPYPTESSKVLARENNDTADYDFDKLFEGYNRISTFFSEPHNMNEGDLHQYHDVDGDGKNEKIILTDLGYNGGDGGYSLGIYKEDGTKLYYAEEYNVSVLFTDDGAEIYYDDKIIETLSMEQLEALYYEKGELENFKDVYESGYKAYGDAISGAVYDESNHEYVIKSYLQGVIAHADCFGYVLVNVGLTEAGTLGVMSYAYCIDK